MNSSELVDKYLSVLYLKTKDDLTKGYNVYIISRLIGADDEQALKIKEYLQRNGLIQNLQNTNDPITILSSAGLDYVFKLRENKIFKTIKFTRSQYLPPEGRPAYHFIYCYDLIDENGKTEKNTIKVSITHVLNLVWGCDQNDIEKLLFQFAKDTVIEKLKFGTLTKAEELALSRKSYPDQCPYSFDNLIEPKFAEYEIEIGQKRIAEKTGSSNFKHQH